MVRGDSITDNLEGEFFCFIYGLSEMILCVTKGECNTFRAKHNIIYHKRGGNARKKGIFEGKVEKMGFIT